MKNREAGLQVIDDRRTEDEYVPVLDLWFDVDALDTASGTVNLEDVIRMLDAAAHEAGATCVPSLPCARMRY
jgi:hypothetical protein